MDELTRLSHVLALKLEDERPISSLDRITEMAQTIFGVDMALVTVLDETNQHFISACGIEGAGTSRADSFCTHAIKRSQVMVVEDATKDPLFTNNALVLGPPHIRFYAGAPLVMQNGAALGTLCIIHKEPRSLSAAEEMILRGLADTVVETIEHVAQEKRLRQAIEEQKAEAAKYLEAAQLGSIIERSTNEIFVFDADSLKFTYVNEGARQNLGYTQEELEKITPVCIKPYFEEESFRALLQPLIQSDVKMLHFETVHQRKDGSTYPVKVRLELDRFGNTPCFIALIRDITLEKTQEAAIAEQMEDLRQFNALVTHDLNTPLRHAAMFSMLAMDSLPKGHESVEHLEVSIKAVQKAQAMLNTLAGYSNLGKGSLEFGPVDLNTVVIDVISSLKIRLEEIGGSIVTSPLPTVHGNATLLTQLFQNLIQNSIKYRSDKSPLIDVSASQKNNSAIVAVADNGLGIDPGYADHVFKIFKRLPETAKTVEGSGIGLSICQKICNLHGGTIHLDTSYRSGSRFIIELPLTLREKT